MDLRAMTICFLLSFLGNQAYAETSKLTMDTLDDLNAYLHQYPSKAIKRISQLESVANQQQASDLIKLRLTLLKCETLIELGEGQAAINLAKMGDAQAKLLKLEQARPYFLNCLADAHDSYDNLKAALPLLDSAIQLARRYQQPQALLNALRLRGQIDTNTENFASAIEDLRLALDISSEIDTQPINWSWPPIAYVYAAMGSLMYATGDINQAVYYSEQASRHEATLGKVKHTLLLNLAMMTLANGEAEKSDQYLQRAKEQIPTLDSELDLAITYSIISVIDLHQNRIANAERLALMGRVTFKKLMKQTFLMRNERQLAEIAFAKNENSKALKYMEEAIKLGIQLNQPAELSHFYQILSKHYAKQDDYQNAFIYQSKQIDALQQANDELSSTRFIQYKARLSQHNIETTQVAHSLTQDSLSNQNKLNWAYSLILVLLLALLIIGVWWFIRVQHAQYIEKQLSKKNEGLPANQQLDNLLNNAKQTNSPLSLILIRTSHIRQVDLPQMLDQIKIKLREQDELVRHSLDEVIIILPYTSVQGAEFVIEQLAPSIQPWQANHKVHMGLASLQQFDTLQSLLKRASVSLLNRLKSSDTVKENPAKETWL